MKIEDIETPCVLVDRRIAEANLVRAQDYADANGMRLRPHIKTHKLPLFARRQIELGAIGITCQKLGEAEVMADAGLTDIFLPYNILGKGKLDRLAALHRRIAISVTADSRTTVDGYAERFRDAGHPLRVLVECDTGAGRCGVQSVAEAVELAQAIDAAPGLRFEGLMTYPPRGKLAEVEAWLTAARDELASRGLEPRTISNGGSPDFYSAAMVKAATEHRPGTYIYSDRTQVAYGHGTIADCALTVIATVVSRPNADRAVVDAGSKALAADLSPAGGHGHVVEYPEAAVTGLSEEHGVIDLSKSSRKPQVGERVRIVPNHVCVVSNLFDAVHITEDGETAEPVPVAARGRLQ